MNDFLIVFIPIVGIMSGITFISAQYELCISDPDTWFTGVVSGIVFSVCLWWIRYHRKE